MKIKLILALAALPFLLISCGNSGKKTDSDNKAEADNFERTDEFDETGDNGEITDDIIDEGATTISNGLDESFLEPSKGFTLKMVAPFLPDIPDIYNMKNEDIPYLTIGRIVDKKGKVFPIYHKESSFAASYEDYYIYIFTQSDFIDNVYYSVIFFPSLDTLNWMAESGTDTVSSLYFYLYLYKNEYVSPKLLVNCPDAILDTTKNGAMKVYIEDGEWLFDGKFGLMSNAYLNYERAAIEKFFGDEFHKLCTCYDVNGSSCVPRECTVEDIDSEPLPPVNPTPGNGAENVATDIELSWSPSSDPDGGEVTYTLFFGENETPVDKIFEKENKTNWKPNSPLKKNTQYFWQVIATDDEENSVSGDIWTFNTNENIETLQPHDFLILLNSNLKGKLEDELTQYAEDAESEGYTPAIRYWTPGDAEKMKDIIKKSYDEHSIKGVVLIGDLPPANFEQTVDYGGDIGVVHEIFPCEYFLMDMDGLWEDTDGNGNYDKYPKKLTLEIFTSRIIGTAKEISDYLKRAHLYRQKGTLFNSKSFFTFIDDDWITYTDENGNVYDDYMGIRGSKWELGSIYGDNYERREEVENTTKATYLDFMKNEGSEYVYQWIHSDPQRIYFDDNFSPNPANILSIDEIIKGNLKGSFYNLFDCSISRYTEKGGNIASEYVKGKYGLATLGSTKTGGVFNPEVMNIALANGENWGTGYQMWVNDIWENFESYNFDYNFIDSWWLGMMIQGDPLLRLTDKKGFVLKSTYPKKFYTKKQQEILNEMKFKK
ncbi:MAG: hypothetical protein ACOX2F_12455 [bacterium]